MEENNKHVLAFFGLIFCSRLQSKAAATAYYESKDE